MSDFLKLSSIDNFCAPNKIHDLVFGYQAFGAVEGRFQNLFQSLPKVSVSSIDITTPVIHIDTENIDKNSQDKLRNILLSLHPWRKGPWRFFDINVDAEWRSNIKWDRIASRLNLQDKWVLDVGCNNAYYSFRMLSLGASGVVAIDPTDLYITQAQIALHYANHLDPLSLFLLPLSLEEFLVKDIAKHNSPSCFDVVFSMGVFYHRRSPFDHLLHLKSLIKQGGEMIFETLVIDGEKGQIIIPPDKYAQMNNIWFLPSILTMEAWLDRAGFSNIELISVNTTSTREQRSVNPWMTYHSLKNTLNPDSPEQTIEGLPAPRRAIWKMDKV